MGVPKGGSGHPHPNGDRYREGALWGSLRGRGFPPYILMGVRKGGLATHVSLWGSGRGGGP